MNIQPLLAFALITSLVIYPSLALAANPISTQARDSVLKQKQVHAGQLMTQQEIKEMRSKIRLAKTPEEREKIRKENHQSMKKRAKKQGVALADKQLKKRDTKESTSSENSLDKRQFISLNRAQENHVLTEMRNLLSGTQVIIAALATSDMESVAKQAKLLGMEMKKKPEDELQSILPEAFMMQGKSVHLAFDSIAKDAEDKKDSKHTLQQLSDALKICQGCHESYRIEVKNN